MDLGAVQSSTGTEVNRTVYLSLGSNLGDRAGNLAQAIKRLGTLGSVIAQSSVYETEPVEVESDQPWYLNCAVAMTTNLDAEVFLHDVLAIEQHMGRQRSGYKVPRSIDIDVIFFGNEIIHSEDLSVPHPAMHRRRFVLDPLAEIAPELQHPILKQTMRQLRDKLPAHAGTVRRIT
jgi:2-amino-4-hydroxy-6-hydroxymethyldihydropteridine diphosphokinase